MSGTSTGTARLEGRVVGNAALSTGLLRLDLELGWPLDFLPGQFAMLNLVGEQELVFGRPFSILAVAGPVISFLYRVVGRGTGLLAGLGRGARLSVLAPLGRPFPPPGDRPVLLLAGGVGLPPLHAWWRRYARTQDRAFFGTRDGGDIPWSLIDERWGVAVDSTEGLDPRRSAHVGLVTEAARLGITLEEAPDGWRMLACGPTPLLRAAARWSAERAWACLVSVEEHMGCGYGVCKGCVVPTRDPDDDPATPPDQRPFRPAMSCEVGPVFAAERIDWDLFGRSTGPEVRGG